MNPYTKTMKSAENINDKRSDARPILARKRRAKAYWERHVISDFKNNDKESQLTISTFPSTQKTIIHNPYLFFLMLICTEVYH